MIAACVVAACSPIVGEANADDHTPDSVGGADQPGPTALDEEKDPCDGAAAPEGMVCIPVSPAVIGSDDGKPAERPRHEVEVSTFFIDRNEVTNAEYRACEREGACPKRTRLPRSYRPFLADDLPATPITWRGATRYCVWAGKRLPTEAEWEKVARGGTEGRPYPWGADAPSCERANFKGCQPRITRPVGSLPAGAYGVHDMAGNGYEWVLDWASDCYDGCPGACGEACRGTDPQGPCDGAPICRGHSERVLKGGSWYWPADQMRGAHRRSQRPISGLHRFSFRCALTTPVLTRAPYWHLQRREALPELTPPSAEELATFAAVREDTDVLKIPACAEIGRATHDCRDPLTYYKSNERHRGLFGRFIENLGGGYVGVGADQAFDFISSARSRWAWLFDYDPTVVRAHYALRAVVLESPTPQAFADAFRLRNFRRTKRWIRQSLRDQPDEIRPTLVAVEALRGRLLYSYLRSINGYSSFRDFGWLSYQEHYDYIRTMFRQGRIQVRKGNMLTDVVMPDIAKSAAALGVPIRVYYSSNADYQWDLTPGYRANIIGLPFDGRSVVVRTMSGGRWVKDSKWIYVVQGGLHMQRKLVRHAPRYISHLMAESQRTDIDHLRVIGLPEADAFGVAARDGDVVPPPG